MNKRILKLFAEAGFHQPAMEREEGLEAKFDKFAELIVKECASRVDHILREKKYGGGTYGDDIREHFGVE
jgi:hypothetical protein